MLDASITEYIEQHTSPEAPVLAELNRMTHLKVLQPRMLSGHVQGKFLEFLSAMSGAQRIVEIGTYTGYSAICLARGMRGGRLTTIDIDEERTPMVKEYIQKAGLEAVIEVLNGHAADILPGLEGPFDMVFIDADKKNYSLYFDLVIDKMATGGWIIADNTLWSGKVTDPTQNDKDTLAIRAYNKKVQDDPRVENVLLSVRDGLMIARKNG
ncbi:MAG: methyltransferase [Sphingobacteriales bacterium BACL12 MAG-120813-bin55]|jgi:caffeoyl-CoA O-methyltransferase|nr:MAG: methyltransferase [Sphingobacteriales bacterium BACL12 MAG-120802-bin5]KRP11603.1 MAG: methyltransferase [Sphingobacteriales bacterium BACL12 MAG-120813-bin55]